MLLGTSGVSELGVVGVLGVVGALAAGVVLGARLACAVADFADAPALTPPVPEALAS
jgi:hypothetical protein